MSTPSHTVDVIVLGAGPAGVHAALAAASAGLTVALFDENPAAGGQVYRAPAFAPNVCATSVDAAHGEALRHALAQSPVQCFFGHKVWNVAEDYRIDALGPQGSLTCHARALIVAVGTSERVVPCEGWTTPGVIGLAAATILLKSQQALPGKTTLIAGCGPLLAAVAAGTLKAGGELVAVADVASRVDWLRTFPVLLARPDLLRQGLSWVWALRRAGVTRLNRYTLVKVSPSGEQGSGPLCAELAPCDAAGRPTGAPRRRFEADCVVVGHGLVPATEITRLLHAQHHYDRARGGWVTTADVHGQTARARLFVAGDAAGIAGAAAAAHHGTLAGLACVRALGLAVSDARFAATQRAHARAARSGRAMGRLMALRAGHVDSIAPDTIVCRCEDVTRAEIDAACRDGARDVNQLKAWTRCGMGPCQGRSCGDVAAELLARRLALPREAVGAFSARTPLRPIRLGDLSGTFDYADIPIPKAAPL